MEEQVGGGQVALAFMQQQEEEQALPRADNPAPAICPPANSTPATPRHTQRPHQLIWDNYKWAMVTQKLAILFLNFKLKSSSGALQKYDKNERQKPRHFFWDVIYRHGQLDPLEHLVHT